jgi:hypothetical protein
LSDEVSTLTGKHYGVKSVCSTLHVPRSSFYERK